MSVEEAEQRVNAQVSNEDRVSRATIVVDNSSDGVQHLKAQVRRAKQQLATTAAKCWWNSGRVLLPLVLIPASLALAYAFFWK